MARRTSIITSQDIEDMFLLTQFGLDPMDAVVTTLFRLDWTVDEQIRAVAPAYARLARRLAIHSLEISNARQKIS